MHRSRHVGSGRRQTIATPIRRLTASAAHHSRHLADLVRMQQFLVRTALTAFTLWIATLIVPGIDFIGGDQTWEKIGIAAFVAIIFGLVKRG